MLLGDAQLSLPGGATLTLEFVARPGTPLPPAGSVRLPLFVGAEERPFAHVELRAETLHGELVLAHPQLDFGCTPVGGLEDSV